MLRQLATDYLKARRALGFGLHDSERMLHDFADFAKQRGESHVRRTTAIEWAAKGTTPGVRHHRLQCLVLFARHVRAEDPGHEVPSSNVFPRVPRQLMPHIYSPDEARRLIDAASSLGSLTSMRVLTAQTFFALLFATGIRISEALALDLDDVRPEGLLIRKTKFKKTRLVPLHQTARDGLGQYLKRRRPIGTRPPSLFVGARGQRLAGNSARKMFEQMRSAANLAVGLRTHLGETRRGSDRDMPVHREAQNLTARPSPHLCDEHPSGNGRHPQGRALARPREPADDRDLFAGRSHREARSARCRQVTHAPQGQVLATRLTARNARGRGRN